MVLVETSGGVPVDISLAGLPFEGRLIARSSPFVTERATTLITCSAEDLIVLKAFAGRVQDWLEVQGIMRQGPRLNRELVLNEVRPLLELKEDLEGVERLQHLFAKHRTP